jgi:hypothetical protein
MMKFEALEYHNRMSIVGWRYIDDPYLFESTVKLL